MVVTKTFAAPRMPLLHARMLAPKSGAFAVSPPGPELGTRAGLTLVRRALPAATLPLSAPAPVPLSKLLSPVTVRAIREAEARRRAAPVAPAVPVPAPSTVQVETAPRATRRPGVLLGGPTQ
ncbi:MAG: hypothetical protein ACE148_14490 [Vicinamibacterales bacterium]